MPDHTPAISTGEYHTAERNFPHLNDSAYRDAWHEIIDRVEAATNRLEDVNPVTLDAYRYLMNSAPSNTPYRIHFTDGVPVCMVTESSGRITVTPATQDDIVRTPVHIRHSPYNPYPRNRIFTSSSPLQFYIQERYRSSLYTVRPIKERTNPHPKPLSNPHNPLLYAQGKYKTELYCNNIPKWYLFGKFYGVDGYLNAKNVRGLYYYADLSTPEMFKNDFLFVSYEHQITECPAMPYLLDRSETKSAAYDEYIQGYEILSFLAMVDIYSHWQDTIESLSRTWDALKEAYNYRIATSGDDKVKFISPISLHDYMLNLMKTNSDTVDFDFTHNHISPNTI